MPTRLLSEVRPLLSKQASLIATLTRPPLPGELAALPDCARLLDVRCDVDLSSIRNEFAGEIMARSADADVVDFDIDHIDASLLAKTPATRRAITWRGHARDLDDLAARLEQITRIEARLYRLELEPMHCGQTVLPIQLLARAGRADVLAYATGPTGFWTRILAPYLGSAYAAGVVGAPADGMPSIAQLVADYGFPDLGDVDEIFGIVGSPVLQSLSPRLHNDGFRMIGSRALYLPFHVERFADFWRDVIQAHALEALGFRVGALTVVSPHKETALAAAHSKTPMVERAFSTNFFVNEGGVWTADTTDPEGVLLTLRERGVEPASRRVAVIGCGGSGRAVAAALHQAGADVTLVNRGFDRGSLAVRLLHLPFLPLAGFSARGYSIVVNATPVGREPGELPFDPDGLAPDTVVVDLVYGAAPTLLVMRTRERGHTTIDGRDVLMTQAMSQFRLMTGHDMPDEVPLRVLGRGHTSAVAAEC